MLGGISWPEILIILVIALIVFGPKRLPEMGRSLGKGIREFRSSLTGEADGEEPPMQPKRPAPPKAHSPAHALPPVRLLSLDPRLSAFVAIALGGGDPGGLGM